MMEINHIAFSNYNPSSLRRAFGIAGQEKVAIAALNVVFRHYADTNAAIPARANRYKISMAQSARHVKLRLSVHNDYAEDFLKGRPRELRSALRMAVICGEDLLNNIKIEDFLKAGIKPENARRYIETARRIQRESNEIRLSSDIDYKPLSGVTAAKPLRESMLLAHIDLLTKIFEMRWGRSKDYDTLSDHLREDVIFAPGYLDKKTTCGRVMAAALDEWEDEIIAFLSKVSPLTNLELISTPASKSQVIAFPAPKR